MSDYCRKNISSSVVCLSVVTRMYCDKTAEVRMVQFSLKCTAQCRRSLLAKFNDEIRRGSSRSGAQLKLGWSDFWLSASCSRKQCEIELMCGNSSLIGSHIWVFDCNKNGWSWMTLNVNLLLCRQCYAYFTKWLRLKSRGFRYKVALYFSYLRIKFDDETARESLQISSIICE